MHAAAVTGGAAVPMPPPDRCHSSAASTTTLVSTQDVLQRYERLLVDLTEQVLEQQADIRELRAALHAAERAAAHKRGTAQPLHRRRRHHSKSVDAGTPIESHDTRRRRGVRSHTRRHHRRDRSSTTSSSRSISTSISGCPATPHVSAILTADGAELRSIAGRSPAPPEHLSLAAAGAAAAEQPTQGANTVVQLTEACPGSPNSTASHVCDVSATSSGEDATAGLTPRPGARAAAAESTSEDGDATAAASLAAAQLTLSLIARESDGTPERCHDASFRGGAPTQQASFDGADAMEYLLTVFSTVKQDRGHHSCAHDELEKTETEGGTSTESTRQRRRHVARELFGSAADGDEASDSTPARPAKEHHRRTPMTYHDVHKYALRNQGGVTEVEEAASSQERYARIVACALAAEAAAFPTALISVATEAREAERCRSSSLSPLTSRATATPMTPSGVLSLRDEDASAQVAELLRFFTPCKA